ncbi:MAG: HAD-IA family hydrolase [Thaumarchaeota archaeon]|nr:HAD-IA family hydrolase [Nitrososphaerota archaeon]
MMIGAPTKRFQVQSVVFDLFHTLVDPEVYRPEGFTRAYKIAEVLRLEDADQFAQWWREMEAQRHVNGSKKVAQYADEYLLKHTGRRCTQEELAQVNQIWGQMHDLALLEPRYEVLSALRALHDRGVKLGLLSNIDEREAVNWTRSPLSPLFDVACLSFDIGYSKPSKEAYSLVLSRLGADASSSIYVGDGGHDELMGARKAGFGLVLFMKGFISRDGAHSPETMKKREADADATIIDLNELVVLVSQSNGSDQIGNDGV